MVMNQEMFNILQAQEHVSRHICAAFVQGPKTILGEKKKNSKNEFQLNNKVAIR